MKKASRPGNNSLTSVTLRAYITHVESDTGNEAGAELMTREQRKIKNGKVKRNRIRKTLRLAIYLRDKFECVYCKRDLHGAAPIELTVDHVTCRSHGGKDTADNLVLACNRCNSSRQNKTVLEFADRNAKRRIVRRITKDITPFRVHARALIKGV